MSELFTLYPKQQMFYDSAQPEVLFGGGANSGKSLSGVFKLYDRARHKGAFEGVMRYRESSLATTFLKDWDRYIPRSSYTHVKTDKMIHIKHGGSICYFGADNEHKLGSKNLTGCLCEELHEHETATAYNKIMTLIRVPCQGLINQVYSCANPSEDPGHWLIERFGIDTAPCQDVEKPTSLYIHTTCRDIGRDEEYIRKTFSNFTRQQRERLLDGRWGVGGVGVVFEDFSDEHIVTERPSGKRTVVGVDEGATDKNPFAAVRCELDGDRIYCTEEIYKKSWTSPSAKVETLAAFCKGAEAVIVDWSATWLWRSLKEKGIPARPCRKGHKSIEVGLDKMAVRMMPDPQGIPNFMVWQGCHNLIKELRTYRYDDKTAQPVDKDNHCIDAVRYVVNYADTGVPIAVWEGAFENAKTRQRDKTGAFIVDADKGKDPDAYVPDPLNDNDFFGGKRQTGYSLASW